MSIKSIPFLALSIIRGYHGKAFLVIQNFLEDVVTHIPASYTGEKFCARNCLSKMVVISPVVLSNCPPVAKFPAF